MKYASTRNSADIVGLREAVFRGLAPDGGLYHPTTEPDLRRLIAEFDDCTPFTEIAGALTTRLFEEEFSAETAHRIAKRAFTFSPEIVRLSENIYVLELFHGPSCAFKDFGASFLAAVMEELLADENRHAVILTATSGDTGSAVARAFHGKANIDVVILYPSGRVSPLQERQLTTVGGNVTALEVAGSFDDCQRMVKETFVDRDLSDRLNLTSANSINLGRLLPQAFYYIYGFTRLAADAHSELSFTVPSGNFGNLTAGIYAWRWGMPVNSFVAATNANDVVPEYIRTGLFSPRPSVATLSNAMDVGNPSNFERMRAIFGNDISRMRTMVHGEVVTDEETTETIRRIHNTHGIFVDPHTAVGILASERYLERELDGEGRILTLATAHPGKFTEVVERATGKKPELPERLARVLTLPKEAVPVTNTTEALKRYLLERFA
jgi:threonine synthase